VVIRDPRLILFFSVLVKRLAGESVPEMTYFVSSGTINLSSINYMFSLPAEIHNIIVGRSRHSERSV